MLHDLRSPKLSKLPLKQSVNRPQSGFLWMSLLTLLNHLHINNIQMLFCDHMIDLLLSGFCSYQFTLYSPLNASVSQCKVLILYAAETAGESCSDAFNLIIVI